MKTFFKWLLLAPIGFLILIFAIVNREPVQVVLDPLAGSESPAFQIVAPLFVVLFLAAILGVMAGGVVTWFAQGRHRRAARHARADVERLRGECDRLRAQLSPRIPSAIERERSRDAA